MNTIFQQEIMLLTSTSFSQKKLSENNCNAETKNFSEIEKLEDACWKGLLNELLPEVITNKKLGISQIGNTEFSLHIELSRYPLIAAMFSINPSYFLATTAYN